MANYTMVRLDKDTLKLVRAHAQDNGRSVQGEVKMRLREAYAPVQSVPSSSKAIVSGAKK